MKLSLEQIRSISKGIVHSYEDCTGIYLSRFTPQQLELYRQHNADLHQRAECSAGIRLHFRTDSDYLYLKAELQKLSSRNFFSFDLYVNGAMVDSLNNFSDRQIPEKYFDLDVPMGVFEKRFSLPQGMKEVCVYLPYTAKTTLMEVSVRDGAALEPIGGRKLMLQFGDSITHGYDALYPSRAYSARLADQLGMDALNKAVAGEKFFPDLAASKDSVEPEIITVAYGTNDWSGSSRETFLRDCSEFYRQLNQNYPKAKIFAIAPVWRTDWDSTQTYGATFAQLAEDMRRLVAPIPNVIFVPGIDLFPHEDRCFGDGGLHPSDYGFEHYARNLASVIISQL